MYYARENAKSKFVKMKTKYIFLGYVDKPEKKLL